MEPKWHGISAVGMFMAVFAAIGAYLYIADSGATIRPRISHLEPVQAIAVPPDAVLKEMERLQAMMKTLVIPPGPKAEPVDLHLFGYHPVAGSRQRSEAAFRPRAGTGSLAGYILTMALVSSKKRFCIVNGMMYNQGSLLPGGEKIVKIEPKRILVSHLQTDRWIEMAASEAPKEKEKKQDAKPSP